MTRLALAALAGAIVAAVLFATLLPQPTGEEVFDLCIVRCDGRSLADAVSNLLLFVPVGAAFALLTKVRRAIALAFLLSLAIEVIQLWVPGRHSSPSDLVFNTLGAALAALALPHANRLLRPTPRTAARLAAGWAAFAMGVLFLGSGLFAPKPTATTWFGQWTPRLGMYAAYEGSVLRARIGDLDLPSRPLASSEAVLTRLERGEPLEVEFIAGPAPREIAPIFAIGELEERQILMVAADRDQLVYRYRTTGRAMGLDSPDLRVPGAFAGVRAGDTVRVRIAPAWQPSVRVDVNGTTREVGIGAMDTWALVLWPTFVARVPALHRMLNVLWLVTLIFPCVWWLRLALRGRRSP